MTAVGAHVTSSRGMCRSVAKSAMCLQCGGEESVNRGLMTAVGAQVTSSMGDKSAGHVPAVWGEVWTW